MPSPFPGMDRYLESPAFWGDFHDSFLIYWKVAINAILPDDYTAGANTRTRVIDLSIGSERAPKSVVFVQLERAVATVETHATATATIEPFTMRQRHDCGAATRSRPVSPRAH